MPQVFITNGGANALSDVANTFRPAGPMDKASDYGLTALSRASDHYLSGDSGFDLSKAKRMSQVRASTLPRKRLPMG